MRCLAISILWTGLSCTPKSKTATVTEDRGTRDYRKVVEIDLGKVVVRQSTFLPDSNRFVFYTTEKGAAGIVEPRIEKE